MIEYNNSASAKKDLLFAKKDPNDDVSQPNEHLLHEDILNHLKAEVLRLENENHMLSKKVDRLTEQCTLLDELPVRPPELFQPANTTSELLELFTKGMGHLDLNAKSIETMLGQLQNWGLLLLKEKQQLLQTQQDLMQKFQKSMLEIENLSMEKSTLQDKLSSSQLQHEKDFNEWQLKLNDLEKALEAKVTRIDQQSQRISSLAQTIGTAEESAKVAQAKLADAEKALEIKNAEIENLKRQIPVNLSNSMRRGMSADFSKVSNGQDSGAVIHVSEEVDAHLPSPVQCSGPELGPEPKRPEKHKLPLIELERIYSNIQHICTSLQSFEESTQKNGRKLEILPFLEQLDANVDKSVKLIQHSDKKIEDQLETMQSFISKIYSLKEAIMRMTEDVIENCRDVSEPTKNLGQWLTALVNQGNSANDQNLLEFDHHASTISTVHELISSMIPQLKEIQDKISSFEELTLDPFEEVKSNNGRAVDFVKKCSSISRDIREVVSNEEEPVNLMPLVESLHSCMESVKKATVGGSSGGGAAGGVEKSSKELEVKKGLGFSQLLDITGKKFIPGKQLSTSDIETDMSSMQSFVEELQAKIAEEEEKNSKTVMLLRTSKKQILKLEKENAESISSNNSLQSKLSASATHLANEKKEAEKLEAKISSQQKQIVILEKKVKELEKKNQEQQKEIARHQQYLQQSKELEDALKQKTKEIKQLEECKNEEMKKQLEGVESLKGNIQNLMMELDTSKQLHSQKSKDYDDLNSQFTSLQVQFRDEKESLTEELEKNKKALQKVLKDFKSSKQAHSDYQNEREHQNRLLEQMQEEREQKEKENEEAKKEIKRLQNEIEEYHQQLDELLGVKLLLEKEQKVVQQLQSLRDDLEKKYGDSQEDNERLLNEIRQKDKHTRSMMKTLQDEIRKLQKVSPNEQQQSRSSSQATSPTGVESSGRSDADSSCSESTATNIQYLKYVITQYLVHKERRNQLLPVIATILHLSPEDVNMLKLSNTK